MTNIFYQLYRCYCSNICYNIINLIQFPKHCLQMRVVISCLLVLHCTVAVVVFIATGRFGVEINEIS